MEVTWSMVILMLSGFGGLTGLAAYVRAKGQNTYDDRSQLTQEQQAFRAAMAAELAALRQQVIGVEARNDTLEAETRRQGELIAALTAQKDYQEKQLKGQAEQIDSLRTQNMTQAAQIAALTEEKAGYAQRVQIAEAQKDFLSRENTQLRQENQRLRERLPARIETEPQTSAG